MDNLFECKVCLLIYNEARKPIVLPCGHSFCSTCIDALSPSDSFCPLCRKDISSSFNDLPINYSLLDLSIAFGKTNDLNSENETKCKNHEDQFIKFWCKISKEWLCELCSQNHMHEELTECIVPVKDALVSFKESIEMSHVKKLIDIMKIIEEIKCFSTISDDLSKKLELINDENKIYLEKTSVMNEKLRELKKRSLKFHFNLTKLNFKMDDIVTVKNWLEMEEQVKKIEKISEIQSEFEKLEILKNEVKYYF